MEKRKNTSLFVSRLEVTDGLPTKAQQRLKTARKVLHTADTAVFSLMPPTRFACWLYSIRSYSMRCTRWSECTCRPAGALPAGCSRRCSPSGPRSAKTTLRWFSFHWTTGMLCEFTISTAPKISTPFELPIASSHHQRTQDDRRRQLPITSARVMAISTAILFIQQYMWICVQNHCIQRHYYMVKFVNLQ